MAINKTLTDYIWKDVVPTDIATLVNKSAEYLVALRTDLNTATEATVDLITKEYNELAKIAKDCASAAVFTASILAAGLYLYVFLPKIIGLFL